MVDGWERGECGEGKGGREIEEWGERRDCGELGEMEIMPQFTKVQKQQTERNPQSKNDDEHNTDNDDNNDDDNNNYEHANDHDEKLKIASDYHYQRSNIMPFCIASISNCICISISISDSICICSCMCI